MFVEENVAELTRSTIAFELYYKEVFIAKDRTVKVSRKFVTSSYTSNMKFVFP